MGHFRSLPASQSDIPSRIGYQLQFYCSEVGFCFREPPLKIGLGARFSLWDLEISKSPAPQQNRVRASSRAHSVA